MAFTEKRPNEVDWFQTDANCMEMQCKICGENSNLVDKTSAFYMGTKNCSHSASDKHEKSKKQVDLIDY